MLGKFQQSHLRIELNASENTIRDSLLKVSQLRQWLWPQFLEPSLPDRLDTGLNFTSWVGLVSIHHQVEIVNDHGLRMLLSQGSMGIMNGIGGDGWVQSRLEGISPLPLNLGPDLEFSKITPIRHHSTLVYLGDDYWGQGYATEAAEASSQIWLRGFTATDNLRSYP